MFLAAMACAAIALGIWAAVLRAGVWQGHPDRHRPARVFCARPGALHLHRFEDGSAQLLCGRRLLVRVNVPG